MIHPFQTLKPEYDDLLSTVRVLRTQDALDAARRLLASKDRYIAVERMAHVPAIEIAGLHNRESDGDFRTYLGNGERLDHVTKLVPRGRGPWLDPCAWEKGALDAIVYDHLNDTSAPWDMSYGCWKGEAWNGFGPRAHGIHTGYLWAGTNHYTQGKYVADGQWDANYQDRQLGLIPVMMALASLSPDIALAMPPHSGAVPAAAPVAPPAGVDQAQFVQAATNKLVAPGLLIVDGSYGRRTREAVRAWQIANQVTPYDGLAGPKTIAAMQAALEIQK